MTGIYWWYFVWKWA